MILVVVYEYRVVVW